MHKYRTMMGDTWDKIAKSQMGDEKYITQLMAANYDWSHVITFGAGALITIPDPVDDTLSSLPPWKL